MKILRHRWSPDRFEVVKQPHITNESQDADNILTLCSKETLEASMLVLSAYIIAGSGYLSTHLLPNCDNSLILIGGLAW